MGGFRFLFVELLRETMALKAMATDLFDSNTSFVLDQFQNNLESIKDQRGERVGTLRISGLCTVPSREYETGSRAGGKDVHAIISGTWDLRPLGPKPGSTPTSRILWKGVDTDKTVCVRQTLPTLCNVAD